MAFVSKVKTQFESTVVFNELIEQGKFPKISHRYRMKATTLEEAVKEMESQYDNNETSMWTAWMIFRVEHITMVSDEEPTDTEKSDVLIAALNSSVTNEVHLVRYRDAEEFSKKTDAIAKQKKQDDESGLTALFEAYDEESKENHTRQYYTRKSLLPRRAEVAYKTFVGETIPFEASESVRKADIKANRWWRKNSHTNG